MLKDSGRTTRSGRRVRTSPQIQVAARCARLAPAWAERQVTSPGSAAGPVGRRGGLARRAWALRGVAHPCTLGVFVTELVLSGPGRRTVRWGKREPQAAHRPPLALASGARHAEWTDCFVAHPGLAGSGSGLFLYVFSRRVTGAESEPRVDSRWLPGPSPFGSCLRDSRTQYSAQGACAKGRPRDL